MNLKYSLHGGLLLVALLLDGCASAPVDIVRLQNDVSADAAPYTRVLVVGVAATKGQRRELEELVTGELSAAGVTAVAAHRLTGLSAVVEQDAVDAAAASTGADAILVAHINSTRVSAEKDPGRVEIKSVCRGGNPVDAFLYEHEELREPDTVSIAHEIVIVSSLYDVASQSRVWMIQSTCIDKASFNEVLAKEAKAVVRQLRLDDLVAATPR